MAHHATDETLETEGWPGDHEPEWWRCLDAQSSATSRAACAMEERKPAGAWREQPFGGELSEFRRFGGFRLPTRVDGGNHFGTDRYFPFFKAELTKVRFPGETSGP